jgi:hypothetical protein
MKMKVVQDDLWFCQDCLMVEVNGDYSGIDYGSAYANPDQRCREIDEGLTKFGPHLVPDFDSETGEGCEEFSRRQCDCCGSPLAGSRHRFAVLSLLSPEETALHLSDTVLHLSTECSPLLSLQDVLLEIQKKWPGVNLEELSIEAISEEVSPDDPSDYGQFLRITRTEE